MLLSPAGHNALIPIVGAARRRVSPLSHREWQKNTNRCLMSPRSSLNGRFRSRSSHTLKQVENFSNLSKYSVAFFLYFYISIVFKERLENITESEGRRRCRRCRIFPFSWPRLYKKTERRERNKKKQRICEICSGSCWIKSHTQK